MNRYFSEFLGTFGLVFAGTGAIVINQVSNGAITHVGIALTFGLIVLAMIYTFGDVSGAHLNPAVTIGFFVARRFPAAQVGTVHPQPVRWCISRERSASLSFPRKQNFGSNLACWFTDAVIYPGGCANFPAHACNLKRFNRREGKGHHGGNCRRRGHCVGGNVRRTDLRSFHESGPFALTRSRQREPATPLDLPDRTHVGSRNCDVCLPVCTAARLL
jgi:hypothetical protein